MAIELMIWLALVALIVGAGTWEWRRELRLAQTLRAGCSPRGEGFGGRRPARQHKSSFGVPVYAGWPTPQLPRW